mgnify:CR=1 FL=1
MLIPCPECSSQVSDKAKACPICGYPIKDDLSEKISNKPTKRKRMKLPNGFGQITKLPNPNLRKQYRVSLTVGKDSRGKPIQKLLKPVAYFKTYNEAYEALVEYHKDPYDLDNDITVNELYEKWREENEKTDTLDQRRMQNSIWPYCESVKNIRVKDLRVKHIKHVMENGVRIERIGPRKGEEVHPTPLIKRRIKGLFTKLLDYAVENDIVEKNVARDFHYSNKELEEFDSDSKDSHIAFTEDELEELWKYHELDWWTDAILIQCYMGWRPSELMNIRLEDVDTENWTITGGAKTAAGMRRIVPIHSKIRSLIEKYKSTAIIANNGYLFVESKRNTWQRNALTFDQYKHRFNKIIAALDLNREHKPHDCRKTFVTRLKKAGADDMAIKKLVGHRITDVTEAAYTERDIEWLRRDVELLK